MEYPATGLHHVTACAGAAQPDIDFFTQVVGQRMIKQTILFDGRYAHYHLYYSNANAEPGTVMTTFPYKRVKGRKGSGQIQATTYTVPGGTMSFWLDHLKRHKIENRGIQERFGQKFIRFMHPSGLEFEVMEDPSDKRVGWETPEIKMDTSVRGFFGTVLSVRETGETERFFVDALGFKKTGQEGAYTRLEIGGGGAAKTVVLHHDPEKPQGSWIFGEGTPHHMALNVPTDSDLLTQKGIYDELGYTDCSEVKDRNYFHSIYCRCPGGILVECAATAEGGFARDEPADQLGTSLLLPPWFEEKRAEIIAMLEPIRVPEYNGAVAVGTAAPGVGPASTPAKGSGVSMSRRDATFIGGDK